MTTQEERGAWGSRVGFILAGAGSAVGLGNIWRFPYVVGQNGGAAFVVIYLICVFVIGYPVMIAELTLGRKTEKNPVGAIKALMPHTAWKYVGYLAVIIVTIVFSWYSVVAGWMVGYFYKTIAGTFANLSAPSETQTIFQNFVKSPLPVMLLTALFISATGYVVLGGIKGGIERLSRFLMPVLLLLLILLAVRSLTLPGASEGIVYYLQPDFSKINVRVILAAMGQALLSLSIGAGTITTYGSYLAKRDNIPTAAGWICFLDTGIALLAGFIILPAVAALGQEYTAGPGLIFHVLPSVFGVMPGGQIFGFGLFLLLIIAALTSTVSMLEVPVAYVVDERKWSRKKAVIFICALSFVMSIPAALSNGANQFLSHLPGIGTDFLSFISSISGDVLMVAGAFTISVFVGWIWSVERAKEEIESENVRFTVGKLWSVLIKYITPVLILIIFVYTFWNTFLA